MKTYAFISFDVPDDSAENFPKGLNLAGNNVENYNVLKIISKEEVTFDDCRFPCKLRNLLIISGIKKVADLEQYTFKRLVRLFIRNGIESRQRAAYLECIIKTLKNFGILLNYSDDNLIDLCDCDLSPKMLKRLNNAGYYYLQDISDSTKFGVSRINGINRINQQILEEKMKENGLWYVG